MTQDRVQILLEIRDKLDGLTKARQQVKGLAGDLEGIKGAVGRAFGQMGGGAFLAGGGIAAFGLAMNSMRERIQEISADGIKANAELEQLRLSMASVLITSNPGRYPDFAAGIKGAMELLPELKKRASDAGMTVTELGNVFAAMAIPLKNGNVPLEKQIELVARITKAVKTLGLEGPQLLQETRAIITGDVRNSAFLGTAIGLKGEEGTKQIEAAKQSGTLFELLTTKLDGFIKVTEGATDAMSILEGKLRAEEISVRAEASLKSFEARKERLKLEKEFTGADPLTGISAWFGGLRSRYNVWFMRKLMGDEASDLVLGRGGRADETARLEEMLAAQRSASAPNYAAYNRSQPKLQATKDDFALAQAELDFEFKNKLISLESYTEQRLKMAADALTAGVIDAAAASKEKQSILLLRRQSEFDAIAERAKARQPLFDSLFSSATVKPAAGSFGMFGTTGQAAAYAAQQDTSRRILDVLVEIRNELRGGVTLDMATL